MSEYTKERAGWLVYSREHNMWWRPNRRGYTADIAEAGRYTKAQAEDCCDTRGSEVFGGPSEVMVPAPESAVRLAEAERLLGEFVAAMEMHIGTAHEEAICAVEDKARAFLEGSK